MSAKKAQRREASEQDDRKQVLLVDDHPLMRRGMAQLIEDESDLAVCGEAADSGEAIECLRRSRPDVIIVDISLKDGSNGVELIKQLRAMDGQLRMLVSSRHDEQVFAERCLHAGAMGYINKHEAPEHLITAIRRVLEGRVYLSEKMSERMLGRMVHRRGDENAQPVETLSDRELEVFELIGKGMTTRQVAQQLHLSVKTIESYQANIKQKLNLQHNTEVIQRAVQWVLEGG